VVVAAALLVIAAGAYGLSAVLGSSGSSASTTAAATSPASSKPVTWLGMEIQTLSPGAAVIETVALGSHGERAGLQPGDVIIEVNHRSINGAGDIGAAIRGLHAGDQVEMQISHGSGIYEIEATLAAPPSVQP
jgi:S1-C subfamily serine protease